jgi:cobalt-zinc-cadmium efflux system membrane fusion protein
MRRTRWLLLAVLALGCEDRHAHEGEAEPKGEHDHEHEHAEGEGDESGQDKAGRRDVLRIDRNMLRDLRVTTRAAESRPAGDSVTALGELRVNEDAYAEVGSSLPARIDKVLVAPGDRVKAGQALAELDSPEIGRARAQLTASNARLEVARKAEARRSALAGDRIVSQRELEATRAELVEAEAEQSAAQQALAALGSARGSGSRFVLSTPIAGTVIERRALRGRMAGGEEPLFVIGDLQRLWLVVHAFERDALRMRVGSTARVTFPALPGRAFEGTVTRLSSQVDPISRTLDVRIEVDNPGGELRPGMSGSAVVPLGDARGAVVAVPVEALQRLEQGWCVFLPRQEPGEFEVRPVGRGRELGAEVEVVSGLRAGEPVVVDGAFLLKAEADESRGGGDGHHHH